jgi:ABC-type branched-subunit amino acid transport system ATPase component/ABC-type branched-subunit amino acid transport system permease subunit
MNDALAARRNIAAALAFGIAVAVYPLLLSDSYHLGVGITAGAIAASTVGVVLLLGLAHQLAIGQAAFSMIGGYSNAILCVDYGWDPFAALAVGAILTMILAYVVAAPILKLRGFVLVMATLALHLMLIVFAIQVSFTGGSPGITGLPKFAIAGWPVGSDLAYYYTVWIIAFITVWIGINIDRSRIGRALRAIAASEDAAGSVGIDITRYKVQIFVIGAGMASLTGSLIAHYLRAIDPTVFAFNYSLNLVTGVIVGGLMSVWGGALGAVVIVGVREILRDLSLPLWETVIMGGLTVVILIVFPRGIAGFIGSLFDRLMSERDSGRVTVVEPGAVALGGLAAPAQPGVMLEVDAVDCSFGNLHAVNNVSFTVQAGSITALIGPNGAGKTTLFNLIGGYQPLDHGSVRFCSRSIERMLPMEIAGLGIGRTFQNLQLFDNMSVLENVMCGQHRLTSTGIFAISQRLPRVAREEAATRQAARDSLAFVGLGGAEAYKPSALAFGHQRLVEIARALALRPSLLLMDEPASGLNDTETERLAELILRIAAAGITVLLVEHDMRIVMGLADHVVVMDHGEKMAEGPTDRVRADPKVIAAYLGVEAQEANEPAA